MFATRDRWGWLLGLAMAVIAAMVCALASPATAAPANRSLQANLSNKAYAAYSHDIKTYLLDAVSAGPLVAAGVGCSSTPPLYFQDAGVGLSLAGVKVGAVTNVSQGLKSGDVQEARSTSTLENVRLPLGAGALTADSIIVRSSTFYNTVTGAFSTQSTMTATKLEVRLSDLLPPIASINGTVAPNTGLDLGALGQLTLHDTTQVGDPAYGAVGRLSRALYLEVLGSASTALGENYSSLYGEPGQTYMFGAGEAVKVATSDQALAVGPLVTAQLPCTGTGNLASQVVATPGLPSALGTLGVVTSTANGDRNGLVATAETTSEVAGVNLLGGLITADAVSSKAVANTSDGAGTVNTAGSGSVLTNLVIAGTPVDINAAPNTQITIPGIGYVTINEQYTYSVGVDVRALTVHVTAGNQLGLPSLDIVVARSYAVLYGPGSTTGQLKQVDKLIGKELTKPEELEQTEQLFQDGTLKKARVLPKQLVVTG